MYRAFNLRLRGNPFDDADVATGRAALATMKASVAGRMRSCFRDDGSIDGLALRESWFPEVGCDVFVSHAHRDERTALGLAGWLRSQFKLSAFVDSAIWGNARDLLRRLDKQHCWDDDLGVYDYDSRNRSTAHVHMMLSTALTAMIDQAECVVFLNTGDPATVRRSVTETESPWIFFEIETVNRVRSREPARLLRKGHEKLGSGNIGGIDEAVRYPLSLGSFTALDLSRLNAWHAEKGRAPLAHALDVLYGM